MKLKLLAAVLTILSLLAMFAVWAAGIWLTAYATVEQIRLFWAMFLVGVLFALTCFWLRSVYSSILEWLEEWNKVEKELLK
jgi:hypothetical protein